MRRTTHARGAAIIIGASALIASRATAQVTIGNTAREMRDAVVDVGYIWTSPFRASGRDWLGVAGVALGFGAFMAVDDRIDRFLVDHPRSTLVRAVEPLRETHKEAARIPTARRILPLSGALVVAGMVSGNSKLREAGYGCISGWAVNSSVRYALYAGVGRSRPSVAEGDQFDYSVPGGDWDKHSLFAGHAANAIVCATFWNTRYHLGLLEPVLYATAGAISLARMSDRRHWASDTFLAAAAGWATARALDARYDRRDAKRDMGHPIVTPTESGVGIGWARTF